MLLLILFAGCLASCAAQTTPSASSFVTPNIETAPQSIQPAAALERPDSAANVVAVLQAAVQSFRELNETTVTPVLMQFFSMIQQFQPDVAFTVRVKNITRV